MALEQELQIEAKWKASGEDEHCQEDIKRHYFCHAWMVPLNFITSVIV